VSTPTSSAPRATLLWLPVGAGGHVVRHTSRWWELARAKVARRRPTPLFHAALEMHDGAAIHVVEMAPAWGAPAVDRGVVAQGPVGVRWLGRSRLFRYEVRCWRDGRIPDREWAVGEPVLLTTDPDDVARLLRHVRDVPALTWGRAVGPTHDMWNSNSVVAWLLATSGLPTDLAPPDGGSAPGWAAGLARATREGV
jgi:hypothetical protein